ncbi:MAG: HEPN domain-containing protein, partial [Deltaproteobacteria bacterium]|nr:HEPN domain-containing protein [Deltaproteobacteria bacterium]MBW2031919.1 HEPN domain-containing protein [Deltaproteobacteria bacterium]
LLEADWGKFYNKIFDSRHEGDYQPLRSFDQEEVKEFLAQAEGFITQMELLLAR